MSRCRDSSRYAITTFGGLSRSELMSRVRSKRNTTTELKLLALLRAARIHGWRRGSRLKGNPDFVFRKERLAVFVDGCFWHGHDCGRNLTPKTNADLWLKKIQGNKSRDRRINRNLSSKGWTVVRIWECRLARRPTECLRRLRKAASRT